jgi:hypothetical protein
VDRDGAVPAFEPRARADPSWQLRQLKNNRIPPPDGLPPSSSRSAAPEAAPTSSSGAASFFPARSRRWKYVGTRSSIRADSDASAIRRPLPCQCRARRCRASGRIERRDRTAVRRAPAGDQPSRAARVPRPRVYLQGRSDRFSSSGCVLRGLGEGSWRNCRPHRSPGSRLDHVVPQVHGLIRDRGGGGGRIEQ